MSRQRQSEIYSMTKSGATVAVAEGWRAQEVVIRPKEQRPLLVHRPIVVHNPGGHLQQLAHGNTLDRSALPALPHDVAALRLEDRVDEGVGGGVESEGAALDELEHGHCRPRPAHIGVYVSAV